MTRFKDKRVIVTGGNSGMGYETAKRFVQEGAKVLITGRNAESLDRAKKELGPQLLTLQNDISNTKGHAQVVETAKKELGQVDILFLNAGVGKFLPFEQSTEAIFDETFSINVKGPYFLAQALLPLMREGSSILFNASIAHGHSSIVRLFRK